MRQQLIQEMAARLCEAEGADPMHEVDVSHLNLKTMPDNLWKSDMTPVGRVYRGPQYLYFWARAVPLALTVEVAVQSGFSDPVRAEFRSN